MRPGLSFRFPAVANSEADVGENTSGQWLMFVAMTLLALVLVLCAANIGIDPSVLWPVPSLIGP
jgi:hypothetical protein